MKKIVLLLLTFAMLLPMGFALVHAEGEDNYGAVYDSVTLSNEVYNELTVIHQSEYDRISESYGTLSAFLFCPDMEVFNESKVFIKINYGEVVFNDGLSVKESVRKSAEKLSNEITTEPKYIAKHIPYGMDDIPEDILNEIHEAGAETFLKDHIQSHYTYSAKKDESNISMVSDCPCLSWDVSIHSFYFRCAFDTQSLFDECKGINTEGDIVLKEIHCFEDYFHDHMERNKGSLVYLDTNQGEYFCFCPDINEPNSIYLIPAELYRNAIESRRYLDEFFTGYRNSGEYSSGHPAYYGVSIDAMVDLSDYAVGEYVLENDYQLKEKANYESYVKYYTVGKDIGFSTAEEFRLAVRASGYFNISAFINAMEKNGTTSIEDYRKALGLPIEKNTPSKLWHLAWIIPVAVLVPTAVAVPIIVVRKRKKREISLSS